MNITLTTHGIELSEKQKDYVNLKIQSLEKFFNNIISVKIDIGIDGNQNKGDIYYIHVNLVVPGKTLRVEEKELTIEKSINKAKDDLQIELKKYKSKFDKKQNKSIRKSDVNTLEIDFDEEI